MLRETLDLTSWVSERSYSINIEYSNSYNTVIWLYFALKIFRTLLFRAVLISYAPHIIYETRVKV